MNMVSIAVSNIIIKLNWLWEKAMRRKSNLVSRIFVKNIKYLSQKLQKMFANTAKLSFRYKKNPIQVSVA